MERTVIYSDPSFEQITRNEIDQAQAALQAVIDTWNGLKLPPLSGRAELYDLLTNEDLVVAEARAAVTRTTSDTNVPVPSQLPVNFGQLYAAISAARQHPYTERPYSMFDIRKGKVVINEAQADQYVNARTLYADTPEQEDFYNDYLAFLRFFNRVNELQGGSLLGNLRQREAWSRLMVLPPEGYNGYAAQMRLDMLREHLNNV